MFAVGTGTIKKCLELWHSVIIKQVLFRLYRLITSVAFVHGRSFRCENDLIAVLPFIWWLWMRWFFSFAKILQFFTRHKIIVSCYSMFATVKVAWTRYFLSPPPLSFIMFYKVSISLPNLITCRQVVRYNAYNLSLCLPSLSHNICLQF